jgi:Leucine-rich repeat (LRR) protein
VEYECPTDCQCSKGTLVVNCANHNLTQIPNGIPKNVHQLILSDNRLNMIKANAFSELTELHEIILAKNQIKSIDINVGQIDGWLTEILAYFY